MWWLCICIMNKIKIVFSAVLLFALSVSVWGRSPKYVFYVIGDGMGSNHVFATEYYMNQMGLGNIGFRHFPVMSMVTTHSASSLVTDSAAAGTALATGHKTTNTMLGVGPDSIALRSLVEMAEAKGYGTGVITSDGLTQATPAAFTVHVSSRYDNEGIASQLLDSGVDFVAGGSISIKSGDEMEWIEKAGQKGYEVFYGDRAYSRVKGKKVMYLPVDLKCHELPYVLDKEEGERTLVDYTDAAIDYLYGNFPKGFFLMIEGANVDHSGHSRDAAGVFSEVMNLSQSVDKVLEFYTRHPEETLIVVTSDHETGALALKGGKLPYLSNQKCSVNGLTQKIGELSKGNAEVSWWQLKHLLRENMGFWDKVPVTKQEEMTLTSLYKDAFLDLNGKSEKDLYHTNNAIAVEAVRYLEEQAGVIFAHRSHTAAPVGLYVKGAKASEFEGCRDNTDIPATIARVAGLR